VNFKVVLEESSDGWVTVTVPSLPGCISQGKTEAEAVKNVKEAIELHVESLAEDGIPVFGKRRERMVAVRV